MGKYVECINEGSINGKDISSMTLAALEEAGIENHLDCLKISMYISQLKNGRHETLTHEAISRFLQEYHLENYMFAFEHHDHNPSGEIISVLDSSRTIVYYRKYLGEVYDHKKSKEDLVERIKEDPNMKSEDTNEYMQKIIENDVSLLMLKEGGEKLLCDIGIAKRKAKGLMRKLFQYP